MLELFLDGFDWNKIAMYTALGLFVAMFILVAVLNAVKKTNHLTTRDIVFAAMCIALSYALSFIRIYRLPQGGSVTPASLLPLMIYAYYFGFKKGLYAGLIYSLLQILQDPQIYNPIQVLLDYPLAFSAIAIVGLFKPLGNKGFFLGGISFLVIRYLCHFLSGIVFFGIWTPAGWAIPIYSLVYNLYVPIDGAIALVVGALLLRSANFTKALESYASTARDQIFASKKDATLSN